VPHDKHAPPTTQGTLPTTQVAEADPAEKLLAAKRKRDEDQKKAELKKLNDEYVHYLRCPRVKEHVAAFLTEYPKPGDKITPGHWYSQFRKPGEPHGKPFIQCQECQAAGELRPWTVSLKVHPRPDRDFDFTIEDKLRTHILGKMPRADAEQDLKEVAHA